MRIKNIHLRNFKRFTDLTIREIPETSKLVLLIGSNGSGKSCLFDAFGYCDASIKQDTRVYDDFFSYFSKNKEIEVVTVDFLFKK